MRFQALQQSTGKTRSIKLAGSKFVSAALVAGITLIAGCGTPEDAQQATEKLLNQKRVEALKKGKDSLTQAREVIFWAGFKTTADIPCFESWLQTHQYTVSYKSQRPEKPFPEFVEFSKSVVPTLDNMNTTTAELITAAATCKGQYQEWESPVVP